MELSSAGNELISQARGHALTPEAVCERYGELVYRFAALMVKDQDHVEDVAQDALIRIVRSLGKYDARRGTLETWIWRLVLSSAGDAARVATRRQRLIGRLAQLLDRGASPSPEVLALERLRDAELVAAVRRLPIQQRRILALRYGAGLDFAEISATLGIAPPAARMRVQRALRFLRRELVEEARE